MSQQRFMPMEQYDAICFGLFALAAVTTVVRLYTRGILLRALGLDDLLITMATILGAIFAACHHLKLVPLQQIYQMAMRSGKFKLDPVMMKLLAESVRTALTLVTDILNRCIKLSILAFFRRVAVDKRHHYLLYFTGACIIAYTLANCLASLFRTSPIRAGWDITVKKSRQGFRPEDLQTSNSAFQATVDVVILLLPIPILAKLQTNRRTKLALAFIFSLGIFSLATTIVRLTRSIKFQKLTGPMEGILMQPELTYWTDIEVNTAIMVANLPALSALFRGLRKSKPTSESLSGYEKGRYGSSGAGSSGPANAQSVTSTARKGVANVTASEGRTFLADEDQEEAELGIGGPGGITRKSEYRVDIEAGGRALPGRGA